jgi:hypothetical protein
MGDWDLLLRLTADRDPLVLPAISCYYTTGAPSRLTGGPTGDADLATIARTRAVCDCVTRPVEQVASRPCESWSSTRVRVR